MKRREFIRTTALAAAALVAILDFPLLAAQTKQKNQTGKWGISQNPYVEPCAIEPITGYLPTFSPVSGAPMTGAFSARYSMVAWLTAAEKSRNATMGSLEVTFSKGRCQTVEKRDGKGAQNPGYTTRTAVQFAGKKNTVAQWTFESQVDGRKDTKFIEEGVWDGKTMRVTTQSFSRQYATANPLIHRWALLPLLASGSIKTAPLVFDMLDDSALRSNQTLRYEGKIEVPIKGGTASLDSYVQTGQGIVPTHYLVDEKGQVQLITMGTVNWALTGR